MANSTERKETRLVARTSSEIEELYSVRLIILGRHYRNF
jgi:hypothetical protein